MDCNLGLFLFQKDAEDWRTPTKESTIIFQKLFSSASLLEFRKAFIMNAEKIGQNIKSITYGIPELAQIIIKVRRRLICAYITEEMGMDKTLPIFVTDDCKTHEDILKTLHSVREASEDYAVVLIKERLKKSVTSIWEHTPTFVDGNEAFLEYKSNTGSEMNLNNMAELISPCGDKAMSKGRTKRRLYNTRASASMEKRRVVDLGENIGVTRSMSKLLQNKVDSKNTPGNHRKKRKI